MAIHATLHSTYSPRYIYIYISISRHGSDSSSSRRCGVATGKPCEWVCLSSFCLVWCAKDRDCWWWSGSPASLGWAKWCIYKDKRSKVQHIFSTEWSSFRPSPPPVVIVENHSLVVVMPINNITANYLFSSAVPSDAITSVIIINFAINAISILCRAAALQQRRFALPRLRRFAAS